MTHRTDPPGWQVLCVPKDGHTDAEYEDAWAVDAARGRFAIADGASESAFAGLWARLLTEGFLGARRPRDLAAWLGEVRQRWSKEVMDLELPWYAEMKREEGAFATFLGLKLVGGAVDGPIRWRAVAVGDTCLVRLRQDGRVSAFPLRCAVDFSNHPALIRSRAGIDPPPRRCHGTLRPGERLLLMTDALAQWFLSIHEQGGRPWEEVVTLLSAEQPDDAFVEWVSRARERGELHNDDVTLLSIECGFR
jgi:hypothetical protein